MVLPFLAISSRGLTCSRISQVQVQTQGLALRGGVGLRTPVVMIYWRLEHGSCADWKAGLPAADENSSEAMAKDSGMVPRGQGSVYDKSHSCRGAQTE